MPLTVSGGTIDDSIDLGDLFKGSTGVVVDQTNKDLVLSQRSHERYMETLDRVFLSDYTQESTTFEKAAMQGNVASHVPFSQPWSPTTRTAAPGA